MYGCVDDFNSPTDDNSWIPGGLTANDLELRKLGSEDDECVSDGDATVPAIEGATSIGGEDDDIEGQWCTCTDDACNGAGLATIAYSLLFLSVIALVAV